MFARVSKYKMKHDKIDAAKAMLEKVKPQIMALPGIKQYVNVVGPDGSGYVISLVESKATSDANQVEVSKIWANFADFLAGPPEVGGYEVIANEMKK